MQRHASPQSYRTRPIGLFYYKEFPSVQHPIFNGLVLEALAYAYRLSGDRDYILKGMRTLESILKHELPTRSVTGRQEDGRTGPF